MLSVRLTQGSLRGPEERTKGILVLCPSLWEVLARFSSGLEPLLLFWVHSSHWCMVMSCKAAMFDIACALVANVVWFSSLLMLAILSYKYYVRNVLIDKPAWHISLAYARPPSSSNVSSLFLISSSFSQHLASWDPFCGFGYGYFHVNLLVDQE